MERVTTGAREPVQLMATLVGATFLLIGIVGFIPGLPSNLYGGLDFAGHNSQAEIFHLFQTSWLHNIVHLALGIAGLALAHTSAGARSYLIVGGVIYLALWLYGPDRRARQRRELRAARHGGRLAPLLPRPRHDHARVHHDGGARAGRTTGCLTALGRELRLPPFVYGGAVDVAVLLASLEAVGGETDLRPALALLSGRELEIPAEELNPARRRALLLLAAGGDPHRGLVLDGRAVTALAEELDRPGRRADLAHGVDGLASEAGDFPRVSAALTELAADRDRAWRAFACALLAEELEE